MIEYEIIEAASALEAKKLFKQWVEKHNKHSIIGLQSHVIAGSEGPLFYLTFMFQRQSNLMPA